MVKAQLSISTIFDRCLVQGCFVRARVGCRGQCLSLLLSPLLGCLSMSLLLLQFQQRQERNLLAVAFKQAAKSLAKRTLCHWEHCSMTPHVQRLVHSDSLTQVISGYFMETVSVGLFVERVVILPSFQTSILAGYGQQLCMTSHQVSVHSCMLLHFLASHDDHKSTDEFSGKVNA